MHELEKGIQQIENYRNILLEKGILGKENMNEYKIGGLLLTHRPLPIPIKNDIGIVITDMRSFIDRLSKHAISKINLKTFWEEFHFISSYSLQEEGKKFTEIKCEISVADWKIIRPQY